MKISIITVAYNSAHTIDVTIRSVLSQSYENIEYILVDGNSTDGTKDIIASYKDPTVRWISEPDKGIYDAMNKGIRMATGDVVGILNSDDFYKDSNVLSRIAKAFKQTKSDSIYGDLAYVEAKNTSKILRYWKSGQYKEGSFLQGWMPPHPTFFVRREVYDKFNAFDTRLKSAADYELMLRLIHKHKISVAYLPEVLVLMRAGGKSNQSLSNRLKANREDHLAWQLNNIRPNLLTLILKPLRKVEQFIFNSYKEELNKQLRSPSVVNSNFKKISTSVS